MKTNINFSFLYDGSSVRIIHLNKEGGSISVQMYWWKPGLRKRDIKIHCHSQEDFLYNYNLSEKQDLIIYEADF